MFGLFPLDVRKILLIIFIVALPLISINIQRNPGEAPWYLQPVTLVGGYIQAGYSQLVFFVRDTTSNYLNLLDIKKENRLLKSRLADLESQMAIMEEIRGENRRLSEIIDFQSAAHMDLLPAKVIGFDLFAQYSTIRINRGTQDGLKEGQAVVTPKGVVGTIMKADTKFSQVLVLNDRYSVIDAVVQRSRARGIVEGKTQTAAQLKYLQRTDDVQKGDLVVTSGLDPILPEGFPIGQVTSVDRKAFGITQQVELEPMVKASELDEILVVTKLKSPNTDDRAK